MTSLKDLYQRVKRKVKKLEGDIKKTDMLKRQMDNDSLSKSDKPLSGSGAGSGADGNSNEQKPDIITVLSSSPFLKLKFRFKNPPVIQNTVLETYKDKITTYESLCKMLNIYISNNKLFGDCGNIVCDNLLEKITGCNVISFFTLAKNFRQIII